MKALRTTLVTVSAILVAASVIASSEALAHAALSGDARFSAVAFGYGLGALAGSMVAGIFRVRFLAIAVACLLALLAAINLFALPHPAWFAPLAAAMLALGWFSGRRLGERLSRNGGVSR